MPSFLSTIDVHLCLVKIQRFTARGNKKHFYLVLLWRNLPQAVYKLQWPTRTSGCETTGGMLTPLWLLLCFPDDRVRDYPLMQSPVHMTVLLLGYVFFSVYVGPRLMANRKPLGLNTAMIVYNFCMVVLNAYIVYEVRWLLTKTPFYS